MIQTPSTEREHWDAIDRTNPVDLHGERKKYASGCRCQMCVQANRDYLREWARRNRAKLRAERERAAQEREGARVVVVYRLFSASGELMYIGQTEDLKRRLYDHRSLQPWGHRIAHAETTRPTTRRAALRYERMAIRSEQPPFNYEHRGDTHGTNARASRCACFRCRSARAEATRRFREERRRRFQEGSLEAPHGSITTYTDLACRCDECRAANTEHRRKQRGSK